MGSYKYYILAGKRYESGLLQGITVDYKIGFNSFKDALTIKLVLESGAIDRDTQGEKVSFHAVRVVELT